MPENTRLPGELEALMVRYQQADAEAASMLVTKLSTQILSFYRVQLRDRAQAEDLLQEFWLRLHRARHTYRPNEPVLPWIYAIARRVRIDDYRRTRRTHWHEVPSEHLPDLASETQQDAAAELGNAERLRLMLQSLPPGQREAVLLLKVSGLSLKEVARATGTTVGAVKQKAHRAYESLRKMLGTNV